MESLQELRQRIYKMAEKASEEWFMKQVHNPFNAYYLYHRPSNNGNHGDIAIVDEYEYLGKGMDQEWLLSHPQRISPGWSKEQVRNWVIQQCQTLPIA